MADDPAGDLVARWRAGDQQAAEDLYRHYASRLIALARSRLSAKLVQRIDPEDVVQSAYRSFFADSRAGRYDLQCGNDLWQLLLTITLHKLQCQVQRHTAQKRAVEQEQSFGSEDSLHGIQAYVAAHGPSPVEAVALIDEVEQIMRHLGPPQRRIVELRLQGHQLGEIAALVSCSLSTVRRVLEDVKRQLEQGQVETSRP
jgi:RNA polymerase sigma factor (sigma-70 family)